MKYVVEFESGERFEVELDPRHQELVRVDGVDQILDVQGTGAGAHVTTHGGVSAQLGLTYDDGDLVVQLPDGRREKVRVEPADVARWRDSVLAQPLKRSSIVPDEFGAPLAGNLVELLVEDGSYVEEGQGFVVIEAMKMINTISAPKSGRVQFFARVGQTLRAGERVAVITSSEGEA